MSVKSFIDWWDGVNAFMGVGPPNPEQWAKIKDRVEALRVASPELPTVARPTASAAPTQLDWRTNARAWDTMFVDVLMTEHGCDGETAIEGLKEKGLDKSCDPRVVAGDVARKWMG